MYSSKSIVRSTISVLNLTRLLYTITLTPSPSSISLLLLPFSYPLSPFFFVCENRLKIIFAGFALFVFLHRIFPSFLRPVLGFNHIRGQIQHDAAVVRHQHSIFSFAQDGFSPFVISLKIAVGGERDHFETKRCRPRLVQQMKRVSHHVHAHQSIHTQTMLQKHSFLTVQTCVEPDAFGILIPQFPSSKDGCFDVPIRRQA